MLENHSVVARNLSAIAIGAGFLTTLLFAMARADEPAPFAKAFIDGSAPGWKELLETDFVNVNCDPDTWTWHDGAIRYFKEAGVWSDAFQRANDALVKRQDVLAAAWTKAKAGTYANDAAFKTAWLKARIDALTAAGFEPYLTE